MKKINYFSLKLSDIETYIQPHKIRGYIGNKFNEYILLHHHYDKNKFLYRYPLVQYKKIDRAYYIIGLEEGAEILKNIWSEIHEINIEGKIIPVNEKELLFKNLEIGETEKPISYKFKTPYLPLNQNNYEEYKLMPYIERKEKLQKIIINNIISFCKAINYTVLERLNVSIDLTAGKSVLKGTLMLSFRGTFKVNFLLPDFIGLGKSVSRGFGTIYKI